MHTPVARVSEELVGGFLAWPVMRIGHPVADFLVRVAHGLIVEERKLPR